MEEEIHCGSIWCDVNFYGTLGLIEETASLITSESLHGSVPPTMDRDAHAVIFQEPLGVILGIAPWNAPLILAMRAVIAAVAMGNTAILKVCLVTVLLSYHSLTHDILGFRAQSSHALLHCPALPGRRLPTWGCQLPDPSRRRCCTDF